MTRNQVRAVMESTLGKCESTPHGIAFGPIRLEPGGGIAGHGTEWWLRFPGHEESSLAAPTGPIRTEKQLRSTLRKTLTKIVRWMVAADETFGS